MNWMSQKSLYNIFLIFVTGGRVADTGEWPATEEVTQSGGRVQAPEPDTHAGTLFCKLSILQELSSES